VIEIHSERGKIGEVDLKGGKLTGSTQGIQHVCDHMVAKHGGHAEAFKAMASLNNGYVWASGAAAQ